MRSNNPDPNQQPAYASGKNYETRDISLPTIITWVTFLFIFIILSSALAYGAYLFLSPKNTNDPAAVSMNGVEIPEPPSPQLQAYPKTEMRDFRVLENAAVNGYGKYRGGESRYRIPIDRAVELTAERGFPKTGAVSREASRANEQRMDTGTQGQQTTPSSQGIDPRNQDNKNAPVR